MKFLEYQEFDDVLIKEKGVVFTLIPDPAVLMHAAVLYRKLTDSYQVVFFTFASDIQAYLRKVGLSTPEVRNQLNQLPFSDAKIDERFFNIRELQVFFTVIIGEVATYVAKKLLALRMRMRSLIDNEHMVAHINMLGVFNIVDMHIADDYSRVCLLNSLTFKDYHSYMVIAYGMCPQQDIEIVIRMDESFTDEYLFLDEMHDWACCYEGDVVVMGIEKEYVLAGREEAREKIAHIESVIPELHDVGGEAVVIQSGICSLLAYCEAEEIRKKQDDGTFFGYDALELYELQALAADITMLLNNRSTRMKAIEAFGWLIDLNMPKIAINVPKKSNDKDGICAQVLPGDLSVRTFFYDHFKQRMACEVSDSAYLQLFDKWAGWIYCTYVALKTDLEIEMRSKRQYSSVSRVENPKFEESRMGRAFVFAPTVTRLFLELPSEIEHAQKEVNALIDLKYVLEEELASQIFPYLPTQDHASCLKHLRDKAAVGLSSEVWRLGHNIFDQMDLIGDELVKWFDELAQKVNSGQHLLERFTESEEFLAGIQESPFYKDVKDVCDVLVVLQSTLFEKILAGTYTKDEYHEYETFFGNVERLHNQVNALQSDATRREKEKEQARALQEHAKLQAQHAIAAKKSHDQNRCEALEDQLLEWCTEVRGEEHVPRFKQMIKDAYACHTEKKKNRKRTRYAKVVHELEQLWDKRESL